MNRVKEKLRKILKLENNAAWRIKNNLE
jgi:hypothetical protein